MGQRSGLRVDLSEPEIITFTSTHSAHLLNPNEGGKMINSIPKRARILFKIGRWGYIVKITEKNVSIVKTYAEVFIYK